jgi:hypothetical protein
MNCPLGDQRAIRGLRIAGSSEDGWIDALASFSSRSVGPLEAGQNAGSQSKPKAAPGALHVPPSEDELLDADAAMSAGSAETLHRHTAGSMAYSRAKLRFLIAQFHVAPDPSRPPSDFWTPAGVFFALKVRPLLQAVAGRLSQNVQESVDTSFGSISGSVALSSLQGERRGGPGRAQGDAIVWMQWSTCAP